MSWNGCMSAHLTRFFSPNLAFHSAVCSTSAIEPSSMWSDYVLRSQIITCLYLFSIWQCSTITNRHTHARHAFHVYMGLALVCPKHGKSCDAWALSSELRATLRLNFQDSYVPGQCAMASWILNSRGSAWFSLSESHICKNQIQEALQCSANLIHRFTSSLNSL